MILVGSGARLTTGETSNNLKSLLAFRIFKLTSQLFLDLKCLSARRNPSES